jgi:ketosteroid isomerase-like protein
MSQENVEVIRQMLDAFNRGDVAAVVASFDGSCELHEPPEMPDRPPRGFRGHDGIREWMANLREAGGVEFEPTAVTSHGELVSLELASQGRGQASGAPFEWTTFAVARVRDAKIVSIHAFLSRNDALEAVGLRE